MSIPPSITYKNGMFYYTEDMAHEKSPKPIKGPIIGPGSVELRQTSKYPPKRK